MGLRDCQYRSILKEGPMELVEKQAKTDVYVFLFSDTFVLTKLVKNTDNYCVIRPPYHLDRIFVHNLKDSRQIFVGYCDEQGVLVDASVLQVDANERQSWLISLNKGKEEHILNKAAF